MTYDEFRAEYLKELKSKFGVRRFAVVRDGGRIMLDGMEVDLSDIRGLGGDPELILIKAHFATGNGLSIGAATEEGFFDPRGGGYFIPARMTRGARSPEESDFEGYPDYVRQAYRFYFGGRR